MFVHTRSGAASFAACLRLLRSYSLAVNACRSGDAVQGWHRTIVLRHRAFGGSGYYVLAQDPAGHFTLRPWHRDDAQADAGGQCREAQCRDTQCQDTQCQEIRPGTPVSVVSHRIVTEGMPVPRDGALLGWVSDHQATALLSVRHGQPGAGSGVPQIRVLVLAGSEPVHWPPFTASPLDDGRLWEYVARGEIVDLAPLVARNAEGAFWVPSQHAARAGQGHGCVVVDRSLRAEEYWVPPGIYMDHWMLREGVPAPDAGHLLTLPGATDLSRRLTTR